MRRIQSILFALSAASSNAYADLTFNLTQGVSPISRDVYQLHMTVFWICVTIGIIVFGAMFYSILYHRKSLGVTAANFHSHTWLEITWSIVPALILVLMAIPATKVLLRMNNYEKDDVTIKITGYQWKWYYEYLEDGIKFFSNNATPIDQMQNKAPKSKNYLREVDHPLVVPVHKKIRFLITSNDVNHAWWVPELAVKRDAIGGLINEAWAKIDKPGVYRGQCAELCGVNHAFMPIVVVAMSDEGYKNWIAQQKGQAATGEADVNKAWTLQELMTKGENVYNTVCAVCHQKSGQGLPPTFPALKGGKIPTGPIEAHMEIVENGKPGTAMQAFKNQLNDVELAAVITYERNAFGNNTGTMVQPSQMKAFRDGKTAKEALTVQPKGTAVPAAVAAPAAAVSAPKGSTEPTAPTAPSATVTPSEPAAAAPEAQARAPVSPAAVAPPFPAVQPPAAPGPAAPTAPAVPAPAQTAPTAATPAPVAPAQTAPTVPTGPTVTPPSPPPPVSTTTPTVTTPPVPAATVSTPAAVAPAPTVSPAAVAPAATPTAATAPAATPTAVTAPTATPTAVTVPAAPTAAPASTTVTPTSVPPSPTQPVVTTPSAPCPTAPGALPAQAVPGATVGPETPAPAGTATSTVIPAVPTATSTPTAPPSAEVLKAAIARGEKIYLAVCVACHQPNGMGLPPTFPALKEAPIVKGPVSGHIDIVMHGKKGTAMMAFKDQYSDQDLADVITYERNAFGNNMGTLVTADQIKAVRQEAPKT